MAELRVVPSGDDESPEGLDPNARLGGLLRQPSWRDESVFASLYDASPHDSTDWCSGSSATRPSPKTRGEEVTEETYLKLSRASSQFGTFRAGAWQCPGGGR